ncbi:uncharacterized protein LY89DRAFT_784680 [Mollisia scopiformis]|uniref:Tyrosine specific protein phosphatases domain-containing protein n=1 Tax=Mollisia scopiformis TaxID=149040 RepID=A0A194X0U5_MOLSC|nr:uncharacterized protein LY89DRAFT_784680 [Mollisia scopiformis]KUJ13818.1 hypothetical protein LY89DRAFT_784680 [Mollisia scopiformis]
MSSQEPQISEFLALCNVSIRDDIPKTKLEKVLKSHPFIPIPGALNLRTISSPSLPPNLIFRSGTLSHLSASALAPLKDTYNITTIFDLRSFEEREKSPTPEIPGIENVWIPNTLVVDSRFQGAGAVTSTMIVEENPEPVTVRIDPADFVANDGKDGFLKMYGEILESHRHAYKAVFKTLRDGHGRVLFHCTAGKDRTGMLSALILALSGASREVIAEDYVLTRIGLEPFRTSLTEVLLKQMGREPNHDLFEEPGMETMCTIKGVIILWVLEWMDEKWASVQEDEYAPDSLYPGVDGYLRKELGFHETDVERIRTQVRSGADLTG